MKSDEPAQPMHASSLRSWGSRHSNRTALSRRVQEQHTWDSCRHASPKVSARTQTEILPAGRRGRRLAAAARPGMRARPRRSPGPARRPPTSCASSRSRSGASAPAAGRRRPAAAAAARRHRSTAARASGACPVAVRAPRPASCAARPPAAAALPGALEGSAMEGSKGAAGMEVDSCSVQAQAFWCAGRS